VGLTDPPPKQVMEVGQEDKKQLFFSLFLLFIVSTDNNYLKSGLLHLTDQPYLQKG
jgi:hypothetical protein